MLTLPQAVTLPALVAQMGTDISIDIGSSVGVLGSAVGAFLTTLIVGAVLIAVVPDYTERMMSSALDEPVESFLYGLVCLVFVILVTFVLAITIIGIVLAIPFAMVAYLIWAVGAAVAYLAIADRLVGHEDGWTKPLLVGAGINGALTVTGIGGIIAFGIGAVGFGAVLRGWLA